MPSPRRRPPPSPDHGPDRGPATPAVSGLSPFRLISRLGLAAVVVVVAIAFATGTAADLPWGALAGFVVIFGAMFLTARRRDRALRDAFPDDEE